MKSVLLFLIFLCFLTRAHCAMAAPQVADHPIRLVYPHDKAECGEFEVAGLPLPDAVSQKKGISKLLVYPGSTRSFVLMLISNGGVQEKFLETLPLEARKNTTLRMRVKIQENRRFSEIKVLPIKFLGFDTIKNANLNGLKLVRKLNCSN